MNELQEVLSSLNQVLNALMYLEASHRPIAGSVHDLMVRQAKQDARRLVELLDRLESP